MEMGERKEGGGLPLLHPPVPPSPEGYLASSAAVRGGHRESLGKGVAMCVCVVPPTTAP